MPRFHRLEKAEAIASEEGLDALIVSRPSNIFYLTDFKGGSRLISSPDGEAFILVGGVDLTAAKEHFSGSSVQIVHIKIGEKLDDLMLDILNELGVRSIGYDELPLGTYERLIERFGADGLKDVAKHMWELRKAKDKDEVARIRKACSIAVKGMEVASELMEPGRTELEVVGEVERAMRRAGSEEHPFNLIVASGKNSALPHALSSEKPFKSGDLVVVDIGATYKGYVSDMTRTFIVGREEAWQRDIYDIVLRAQEEARRAVRAGVKASDVDAVARNIIKRASYEPEEVFIHSLGHGLGVEVHEPPRIGPGVEEVLGVGYTITIEPGIYLPGKGGVRIEDTVLVLEDGHEVLTPFPYGLKPGEKP